MTSQREWRVWIVAGVVALVGGTGIAALIIWLFFIPRDLPADLVYNSNSDGSLDWTLDIPPSTWHEIVATDALGAPIVGERTQLRVMKLVAQGFEHWDINIGGCFTTDVYMNPDGSARYQGKCKWSGRPGEQRS